MQTFQAESMAAALEKVKKSLGSEAVILHTRTLKRGGVLGVGARTLVEVTASRDLGALHKAERSAIIGRRQQQQRPGGGRSQQQATTSPASRTSVEQTSTMRTPPGQRHTSAVPQQQDIASFSSALRGEMGEIRAMVRELLDRPQYARPEGKPEVSKDLKEIYTHLLQNQVAEELAQEIIKQAEDRLAELRQRTESLAGSDDDEARRTAAQMEQRLQQLVPELLVESIERMLPDCAPLDVPETSRPRCVALVGPTGVGKTTTIAKLAAHFKLREKKRVGLMTTDTYRIAAVEQLKSYADILNIPLEIVLSPESMRPAIEKLSHCDVILVDTSGRSQRDHDRLDQLRMFLSEARGALARAGSDADTNTGNEGQAADADSSAVGSARREDPRLEVHLVLSCTAHPTQLVEVAEAFSPLGVDKVLFTKLDEAVGLGVILNVIRRLDARLSYLTTGQDVPDDIEVGHRRRVAELIMGRRLDSGREGSSSSLAARAVDHVA